MFRAGKRREWIETPEIRDIQLEMLEFIDQVCRSSSLEYSLASGTLLGAVRNGGFIPWDDDIDIALRYNDFDELLHLLAHVLPAHYSLYHYSCCQSFISFAKLFNNLTGTTSNCDRLCRDVGVFIDIFPMHVVPENSVLWQCHRKRVRRAANMLAASSPRGLDYAPATAFPKHIAKAAIRLPMHLRCRGRWEVLATELDRELRRYSDSGSSKVAFPASEYANAIFDAEMWDKYTDTEFEGMKVRRIVAYDSYLTTQYGDYLQLPPMSQRRNHSYYRFYWKER